LPILLHAYILSLVQFEIYAGHSTLKLHNLLWR